MHKLKNIKWLPILMILSILVIAGFQAYWLKKSYEREKRTLDIRTNMLFRETVRNVQASKLKIDKMNFDSIQRGSRIFMQRSRVGNVESTRTVKGRNSGSHIRSQQQKMAGMMDVLIKKAHDSGAKRVIIHDEQQISRRQNRIIQFLFDLDSLQDTIRVKEISTAYSKRLQEQNLDVPFTVSQVPTRETEEPVYNEVTLGFANPITYRLDLGNTLPLILQRMIAPILFSIFLVGFTILSFTILYRSLVRQQRLANIKNEFISNITHELKTPIATVSVAIEALRNFSSNIDQHKTKEYLDISANELQRLSLLVDKVLKLSMFEKKEIELRHEPLDMQELLAEVTDSLRLQFENRKATVKVEVEGDTSLEGDRLHLVSVIFNILDNALKYSLAAPQINIRASGSQDHVTVRFSDSGIGIPKEYHSKIFEKFFRVPTGNVHNAKGYGLGLSYVSHVIDKHHGKIEVESEHEIGTTFIISLPRKQSS